MAIHLLKNSGHKENCKGEDGKIVEEEKDQKVVVMPIIKCIHIMKPEQILSSMCLTVMRWVILGGHRVQRVRDESEIYNMTLGHDKPRKLAKTRCAVRVRSSGYQKIVFVDVSEKNNGWRYSDN